SGGHSAPGGQRVTVRRHSVMGHTQMGDGMGMKISVEEMERPRVALFNRLTPTSRGFVDTAIPGYERLIYNVIGRGVTEDSTLRPAITDARDFNLTLVKQVPGNQVGLHDHPTGEVFTPLTGRRVVYWG